MVYVQWEKPKKFYKMIDMYVIRYWSKSGEIFGERQAGGGDLEVIMVFILSTSKFLYNTIGSVKNILKKISRTRYT